MSPYAGHLFVKSIRDQLAGACIYPDENALRAECGALAAMLPLMRQYRRERQEEGLRSVDIPPIPLPSALFPTLAAFRDLRVFGLDIMFVAHEAGPVALQDRPALASGSQPQPTAEEEHP